MRILNAIHNQSIGGVEQMFRNYTIALKNSGHEVALLISKNNYDYTNVKRIFKLNNFSQISDFFHLLWILLIFRPNLVICHSNRIMKWMKIFAKFTPIKSVAINHGISFKSSLNCDYIININSQIHEMVIGAGFNRENSFVIENVIENNYPYRARQLNEKTPVIAMYGRIEPRKGFDILIKAGEILAKKNYDFSLKIGGFEVEGSYGLQNVKNLAKDRGVYEKCDFVGVVYDKADFFKDVDIFVIPSREEPFGLVILESFANSVLAISSNTIGGKMLINHGEDGILFENENYENLAQKIIYALENKENYCNYTKKAYEKLEKNFNFDVFSAKFGDFLTKTMK